MTWPSIPQRWDGPILSWIRIDNPDADGVGEVLARSPTVMNGYVGVEPGVNAETVDADGWLHSGDLGHLSEDGYLFIDSRSKDVVIWGGENIACPHVEAAIAIHPAVVEVAALGVPRPDLGEELVAVVGTRAMPNRRPSKHWPVTSPACCPTSPSPRSGRSARSRCPPWPERRWTRRHFADRSLQRPTVAAPSCRTPTGNGGAVKLVVPAADGSLRAEQGGIRSCGDARLTRAPAQCYAGAQQSWANAPHAMDDFEGTTCSHPVHPNCHLVAPRSF